jgi:hypothetical protein
MTTKKKDISILRVNHLRGPNIWTYRPVIETWLDIGALEDTPSNMLPGLYERLITWLPGLIEHRCGVGERGDFWSVCVKVPGLVTSLSMSYWNCKILQECAPASDKPVRQV